MRHLSTYFCGISPSFQREIPQPPSHTCRTELTTGRLSGTKTRSTTLGTCNTRISWVHSYCDWNQLRHISWELKKNICPNSCKTAPLFTTHTHNTSLDSLNKHMCCYLQRIAITHKLKTAASLPSAASLLKLWNQSLFRLRLASSPFHTGYGRDNGRICRKAYSRMI